MQATADVFSPCRRAFVGVGFKSAAVADFFLGEGVDIAARGVVADIAHAVGVPIALNLLAVDGFIGVVTGVLSGGVPGAGVGAGNAVVDAVGNPVGIGIGGH